MAIQVYQLSVERGLPATFYIALESQATLGVIQSNPTIAAGDFVAFLDGVSLGNLDTLPSVTPSSSKSVKVDLSEAETTGENLLIIGSDAAGAQWYDVVIQVTTWTGINSKPAALISEPPVELATYRDMLQWMYAVARGHVSQTGNQQTLYSFTNKVLGIARAQDNATIFTRGKWRQQSAWNTIEYAFFAGNDIGAYDAAATGFAGGAFDGRYVYLANAQYGDKIARIDTQADFSTSGAFAYFDPTSATGGVAGFRGCVFDGRYVWFIPYQNATDGYHGKYLRYDTTATFSSAGSWSVMNMATVDAALVGYWGGVFDGRYVYLIPWEQSSGVYHGNVVKYDTEGYAGLSSADAHPFIDLADWQTSAKGYRGGCFDGRYVYLVHGIGGLMCRYDTLEDFDQEASWDFFNLAGVDTAYIEYCGCIYDGRYIYYVPQGGSPYHGLVARYDTQGDFTVAASWSVVDVAASDSNRKGFAGGGFDGKYVYLVPFENAGGAHREILRYDTQDTWAASAWEAYDHGGAFSGYQGYNGAVFDGQYMYFVPWEDSGTPHGKILRHQSVDENIYPDTIFGGSFM